MTTRRLLTTGGLAALQALVILALAPAAVAAANIAPPVYALLSISSVLLIHLAPRLVHLRFAALLTAALTALIIVPFSAIGFLAAIPLLVQGVVIDVTLSLTPTRRPWHFLLAGALAGIAAFFVSLPVFSFEHLTPLMLTLTFAARLIAGTAAAALAGAIARALRAAGVGERQNAKPS